MKITIENLTKRFPGRGKKAADVIAVSDFSYEFPDGKLIGLLGPSGCGKSTVLNMISGLVSPTDGKIFFGDGFALSFGSNENVDDRSERYRSAIGWN